MNTQPSPLLLGGSEPARNLGMEVPVGKENKVKKKKRKKSKKIYWSTKPVVWIGLEVYSHWMEPLCLAT